MNTQIHNTTVHANFPWDDSLYPDKEKKDFSREFGIKNETDDKRKIPMGMQKKLHHSMAPLGEVY